MICWNFVYIHYGSLIWWYNFGTTSRNNLFAQTYFRGGSYKVLSYQEIILVKWWMVLLAILLTGSIFRTVLRSQRNLDSPPLMGRKEIWHSVFYMKKNDTQTYTHTLLSISLYQVAKIVSYCAFSIRPKTELGFNFEFFLLSLKTRS